MIPYILNFSDDDSLNVLDTPWFHLNFTSVSNRKTSIF